MNDAGFEMIKFAADGGNEECTETDLVAAHVCLGGGYLLAIDRRL